MQPFATRTSFNPDVKYNRELRTPRRFNEKNKRIDELKISYSYSKTSILEKVRINEFRLNLEDRIKKEDYIQLDNQSYFGRIIASLETFKKFNK